MKTKVVATIAVALPVWVLPLQPALDDQCADPTYARLHKMICDDYSSGGTGFGVGGTVTSGGGGSGGGGLLGGIPIVGGLLKGLGL